MKNGQEYSMYEKEEIDAIRIYLGVLPPVELKAIILRFWGRYTIAEIAGEIRKSWDEADQIINRAVGRLRRLVVDDPIFQSKLFRSVAA